MSTWDKKEKEQSIRQDIADRMDKKLISLSNHDRHIIMKNAKLSAELAGKIEKEAPGWHRLAAAQSILFSIVETTLIESENLEQE